MSQDNKLIKDGVGNTFTLRLKDVSATGDGSLQRPVNYSTLYPVEYGTGGVYAHCARITLTAGLAANAPIWSFQWTSNTMLAVIRRLKLNLNVGGTAFTAAATMEIDSYRATGFTAPDTGGVQANLNNAGKMRSTMASSLAVVMYGSPLVPGTRVLDPDPLDSIVLPVPATAKTVIGSNIRLFDKAQGEHPLVLAQNEGLVLRASPSDATGTWYCAMTCEWDEVPLMMF
jgi:hypothetical protein